MSSHRDWMDAAGGWTEVALITNHGYAGVEIPLGGAPDTGGQNFYVNQLALALERAGYAVTIFARGGFPFFGSERMRQGEERLSDRVRYVYVPGGGCGFIRKEDIAVALDEQVEWLYAFVCAEAELRGCRPWEVYEFVNTHYWDAAVMGIGLVERWIDDVAARQVTDALDGVVPQDRLGRLHQDRHWLAVGSCPALHTGVLLLEPAPAGPAPRRAVDALVGWSGRTAVTLPEGSRTRLFERIERACEVVSPALVPLRSALYLGEAVIEAWDRDGRAGDDFAAVDRHVWTPHSLGMLKSFNYRDKPVDVRRDLKFRERRNHEQLVCDWTRAFAATSGEIAEYLVSHHGVPAESVFYFPPCVDRTLFRVYDGPEADRTYDYLSALSGVDVVDLRQGLIVFESSRMDSTKRKDVLLEAFARAARSIPTAYLFIGGGPENEVFSELARLRESDPVLRQRAFLTGFIPDEVMYPLFSIADLYVTPSEMEGFGMSASQAAAASTALVASDLVPFATLFVPEDAVVVRAGDVERFAASIARLLGDAQERGHRADRLSEATRVLDWDVQTGRFIDHLRTRGIDVSGGRRKP